MSIARIREIIISNINKNLKFRFNGSRNQIEEFTGTIIEAYNSVFLIKLSDTNIKRSFSYTDILIGNLQINIGDLNCKKTKN